MIMFYFNVLVLSLCLACLGIVLAEGQKIRRTVLAIQRARDLADDLRIVEERIEGCEKSLKRLHSRAGMREVRERRNGGAPGSVPDWRDDPEGYRTAMESNLGIGIGKPKGKPQ